MQIAENGNFCILEVHYRFFDDSHTMDAFVQNKCESQLLGIVNEVAKLYKIALVIEVEPATEGGHTRRYRFSPRENDNDEGNAKQPFSVQLRVALLVAVFTTISVIISGIVTKGFEHTVVGMTDPVKDSLDKANLKNAQADNEIKNQQIKNQKVKDSLEIENLTADLEIKKHQLYRNRSAGKKRATLYTTLDNYPKVSSVSIQVLNSSNVSITGEQIVERDEFKSLSREPSNTFYLEAIHQGDNLDKHKLQLDSLKQQTGYSYQDTTPVKPPAPMSSKKPNTHKNK